LSMFISWACRGLEYLNVTPTPLYSFMAWYIDAKTTLFIVEYCHDNTEQSAVSYQQRESHPSSSYSVMRSNNFVCGFHSRYNTCLTSINVAVRWLAVLLRIREVPGSNLVPETGCPDWGSSWFSSVSTIKHLGRIKSTNLPGLTWRCHKEEETLVDRK
jgi:hypothetical protein